MATCMVSSMRHNGCSTVCYPLSLNCKRMNRSSDQGVNVESADESSDLISGSKPVHLHLLYIPI